MEIPSSFKYDTVLNRPNPTRIAVRPEPTIRYIECQRNHAAHTGNRILDGCGEFMPNGEQGTPESMRCAACACHRNFHRREIGGGMAAPAILHQSAANQIRYHAPPRGTMMMAFGGGVHAEASSDREFWLARSDGEGSRKRMRTKFTEEQKEKMTEFAEKIGWRIQKEEDDQVDKFCEEAGVKRRVFKVWMHNNKQAIKRKFQSQS